MTKFLTFFCIFCSSFLFSQQKALSDAEYFEFQDKTRAFFSTDLDSAFFYAAKIEKSTNITHKAFANGIQACLYSKKRDFKKADFYYQKAIQLINKAPDSKLKVQNFSFILNYGGIIDFDKGDFSKALDKYLKAKRLSESINDIVQIIKLNGNIGLIEGDIGNYKKAITFTRLSNLLVDKYKIQFPKSQYVQIKCNSNSNLGRFYLSSYIEVSKKKIFLDSSLYFYVKALEFSDNGSENRIKILKNIGNVYFYKKQIEEAKKNYFSVAKLAFEKELYSEYYSANFNLGYLFYNQKRFKEALIYFHKVKLMDNFDLHNTVDYMNASRLLAKIYEKLGDTAQANYYSDIYLTLYKTNQSKLNNEILDINYKTSNQDLAKEMEQVNQDSAKQLLIKDIVYGFIGMLMLLMLILFIRNYKKRKEAEKKVDQILLQFKNKKLELTNTIEVLEFRIEEPDTDEKQNEIFSKTDIIAFDKEKSKNISITEENEKELMKKMKELERKQYYLKPEFSLQEAAKKIKTNTTYLSYVVNKNYNKTFSTYYNELRINYVINEIINNKTYREYSTQAIAESAGFKNADSFASSFKKKTGVTPFQFINEIKKRGGI